MRFLMIICIGILAFPGLTQSIELDNTKPTLKITNASNQVRTELGYFRGLSRYRLEMYAPTGDKTVTIGGGEDQNSYGFMNLQGNLSIKNLSGDNSIVLVNDINQSGLGRVKTDQLEITGGADLAEYFEVNDMNEIRPGLLVSIDPKNPGELIISRQPVDQKVIGIVSGANGLGTGMFMGQQGSIANGRHPIALTGRAYVYVSEENGKIKPGDFLTPSSTPGYAMKARKLKKTAGAIIGKAMSTMDENGFVLVLINLQ